MHANRWLRPGDRIRASIEQIGVFEVGIQEAAGPPVLRSGRTASGPFIGPGEAQWMSSEHNRRGVEIPSRDL